MDVYSEGIHGSFRAAFSFLFYKPKNDSARHCEFFRAALGMLVKIKNFMNSIHALGMRSRVRSS